jgi:hypothetical protein
MVKGRKGLERKWFSVFVHFSILEKVPNPYVNGKISLEDEIELDHAQLLIHYTYTNYYRLRKKTESLDLERVIFST